MDITFLGATKNVTGSKFLLTIGSKKVLVDCGLFQGHKELRLRNWAKLPINPKDIDAVLLTHAHIDHSGYLPLLIKNGFTGKIYCTQGTKDLCAILLPDSGHIQEEDAARANKYHYSKHKPALPLYTMQDGINALEYFTALDFNKSYQLFNAIEITLLPAGHIIGSSFIKLQYHGTSILFTGDIGRAHHPVMKPPTVVPETDYLVIESTYGNRLHDQLDPMDQLAEMITKTIANGGSVIIPAFAVGRTQDLLYALHALKTTRRIPDVPIYLDSPMAQNVSDLLKQYSTEHRLTKEQCHDICGIAKYITTVDESKAIDQQTMPSIIISASGMAEGGRILHHLKAFLPGHKNTILLTGYQYPGTRGDQLLRGDPTIKIHGESVPVRANIQMILNMSAHADYSEILNWLTQFKRQPKKVFIVHGTEDSASALKEKIETELHWQCIVPDYLQTEKI